MSAGIPERGVIHPNFGFDICQRGSHRLTDPCLGDSILLQSSTISLDLFVCEAATLFGPDVGVECPVIEVQGLLPVALDCVPETRNLSAQATDSGTTLSWSEMLCVDTYDVIRGSLSLVSDDLGAVVCIVNDTTAISTEGNPDDEVPGTGEAYFYVVRPNGPLGFDHYGVNSAGLERTPSSGDCLF